MKRPQKFKLHNSQLCDCECVRYTSDAKGDSIERSLKISSDCLSLGRSRKSSKAMTELSMTTNPPPPPLTVELSALPAPPELLFDVSPPELVTSDVLTSLPLSLFTELLWFCWAAARPRVNSSNCSSTSSMLISDLLGWITSHNFGLQKKRYPMIYYILSLYRN